MTLLCLTSLLATFGCSRSATDYVERGNTLFTAAKYTDAAIQYRKAIQKDAGFGPAYYRLGLAQLELNQGAEALQALSRAVDLMPQNEEAMAKLGDLSFAAYLASPQRPKPLYDKVATMADRITARNPQSFDGMRLKGNLALLDQRPKEAVELLSKANQVKPLNRDVVMALSQALILDNRWPEAEKLALELIDKEKSFGPIYDVLYRQYVQTNRDADATHILTLKVDNNPKETAYVIQLAGHYARTKKPEMSAQILQKLLDNPKDFPQARLLVGDYYGRTGNWEEAVRQFEEGARSVPKEKAIYQVRIARVFEAKGNHDEAIRVLTDILKEAPKTEDALKLRAALLLRKRTKESAAAASTDFKELVQMKPDDPVLHYDLGSAYLVAGDAEAARAQFQEAIRRNGRFSEAKFLLAYVLIAQNRVAEGLRLADDLLTVSPESPTFRLLRARCLMRLDRRDESRNELSRLARQFPRAREVQLQLGVLAVLDKKYADAQQVFQKLQQSDPKDPRTATALAEAFAGQGQFEKALQLLRSEADKTNSAGIRRLLALTAARANNLDLAIAEYEKLLASEPKSVELRLRLGEVYQAKGDPGKAVNLFREASQLAPKDPEPAVTLAEALRATGKFDEAVSIYRQVMSSTPDNAVVLNNTADLLCETGGNLDEALKYAQRALQKAPGNPSYTDTLGWIYAKKGMNDSAVRIFNNLAQKEPANSTFRYHYGAVLLATGQKEQAKRELEAALANSPRPAEAAKIQDLLRKTS